MAFTVSFPTASPPVPTGTLAAWLTDRGEPFAEAEGDALSLRALPVRFVSSPQNASLQAQIDLTPSVPLTRLVDTLFEVSSRAGADVNLAGTGTVTRQDLWLRLADEQDRMRIALGLRRAREHGNADEVHKRLWALIAAVRVGRDDRWDVTAERVVEMVEVVDAPAADSGGMTVEQARWLADDPKVGDAVAVPVGGYVHCLVWRWLSEAYPGLADPAP